MELLKSCFGLFQDFDLELAACVWAFECSNRYILVSRVEYKVPCMAACTARRSRLQKESAKVTLQARCLKYRNCNTL